MGKLLGVLLGVITAVGGFVDMAGVVNATQAGARYELGLLWTLIPGMIGLIVYLDMCGRLAIASGRTLFDAIRDRLGFKLALVPLIATLIVNTLTLAIELGGMALAVELAVGVSRYVWFVVAAALVFFVLWRVGYDLLENGAALIGLTMLVAVVAALALRPPWGRIGLAAVHPPITGDLAGYAFASVGLLGSYLTPYQFYFYSSGAIEGEWTGEDLVVNRITAVLGTVCGAVMYVALIVAAALVLNPRGADVHSLADAGAPIREVLGTLGWDVFLVGVFAVSLGAALENSLAGAYALCQYAGWDWGKRAPPVDAPLFHLTYIVMLVLALAILLVGVDVVGLSLVAMAVAAATLPFTFGPLLLIANEEVFMGEQRNSTPVNVAGVAVLVLLVVVSLATVPLWLLGGGG